MNFQERQRITSVAEGMTELMSMDSSEVSNTRDEQEEEVMYQPLKVYLRVRPFSKAELENNENQDCLIIENQETVTLHAPKYSTAMKNSEKGIGQSAHQFTFTQVFGPETSQSEFFEGTMKDIVKTYINGVNGLVFTYGVTNAGKSFTVQGCSKDGGILPRSLDLIFNHVRGRQYPKMNLKPCFSNLTKRLNDTQVKQEESIKTALLASLKEDTENTSKSITTSSASGSTSSSCSSPSFVLNESDSEVYSKCPRTLASVWVSFFEIYNEYIYDLLDLVPASKNQKRKVLRICEDQGGNSYVKDLKWISIKSTDEACKILKVGNKNRSLACTRMNQQSSRSHSIFSIRLLSLSDESVPRVLGVSELSLCDLAGSERCHKAQTFGDRLKEAGNINNSLLILGKCIAALKQNQNPKLRPAYIPFRESKLTRLFQPFFCGKGKACMIVNINQCASTYDETLHVMKFSAVAKQVIQTFQHKIFDYFPKKYIGRDDRPTVHFDDLSAEQLPEDSCISSEEEEIDITIMNHEDLLKMTEILKSKLIAERQGKLLLEVQIRKEMAKAMFQQLMETEESWSKRLEDLKERYEEKLESKFQMYKEAIKKHAYMCAMDQIEDRYVPIEEFIAEQAKVEDREMKILELKAKLGKLNTLPSESPNLDSAEGNIDPDIKCSASDALQGQCDERDKQIRSLKLKIEKLNEMLQDANELCRQAMEENNRLKQVMMHKEEEVKGLQNWAKRGNELEATVSLLQEELRESKKLLSTDSKHQKSKKGFFANLKHTLADVPKTLGDKDSEKPEASSTSSSQVTSATRKAEMVGELHFQ
ncbi:kinesin-like protein KIF20A [Lacerta agilis]|uniref:kinesin-like protein KIF20A n=1 Tax=Lacerta agilis TaxID=80427 RepID=UPI00141938BF|nr:kinesin-like protein KIF20A [Lacerta agilis]